MCEFLNYRNHMHPNPGRTAPNTGSTAPNPVSPPNSFKFQILLDPTQVNGLLIDSKDTKNKKIIHL